MTRKVCEIVRSKYITMYARYIHIPYNKHRLGVVNTRLLAAYPAILVGRELELSYNSLCGSSVVSVRPDTSGMLPDLPQRLFALWLADCQQLNKMPEQCDEW
jgi:hypothetical protein